jgi:uncharacterized protein YjiK
MKFKRFWVLAGLTLALSVFAFSKIPMLKFTRWTSLKVHEPSDIALANDGLSYYVVSDDDAAVYQLDLEGKVLRKSKTLGIDLEAVCVRPDFLYVVDETPRKVYQLDYNTLEVIRTFYVPYSGGRNKSFESLTYNETKKCFVMITERDPVIIFELDHDFRQINEMYWKNARDISAATYHNGFIWLLSDEDMTVFKCDPKTYGIVSQWRINVHNPEGIVFNGQEMLIVADDLERLYRFNHPEAQ